ncbi:MAG: tRNA pseudouridine synthase A [Magnetococcus sp. DMHC-6]
MARYRLILEYDGRGYCGWQHQSGDRLTVQSDLEQALKCLCGHEIRVHGAGRTDSGVHALAQVAHFDTHREIPIAIYMRSLNALTSQALSVRQVELVADDFHARFDATYREYMYRLLNRPGPTALDRFRVWHIFHPLDRPAMGEALSILVGKHDFSSFRASTCQANSPSYGLF